MRLISGDLRDSRSWCSLIEPETRHALLELVLPVLVVLPPLRDELRELRLDREDRVGKYAVFVSHF